MTAPAATTETVGVPPKTFTIVTTAQVERTYYVVQAANEAQAATRLRTHLKDPEMLREGVVVEQTAKQADATPQRIKKAPK